MKIRSDFVTNSSSYSTSEIMIDNPVLLELLMRYKEKGVSAFPFEIGSGKFLGVEPGMDPKDCLEEEKLGFSKTPALYYFGEDSVWQYPPENLDEIILKIIEIVQEGSAIEEQVKEELGKELLERKDEIKNAHRKIYWDFSFTTNEHDYEVAGYVNQTWKFLYDRGKGERVVFVVESDDTGEIIEEE